MLKYNPSKTENTTRLNVMIPDLNRSNGFSRRKTRGDIYMSNAFLRTLIIIKIIIISIIIKEIKGDVKNQP